MNKKIIIPIALIAFGLVFYFWYFSDTKIITRSTESLIECFEKEAGDGRFGGAITTSTFRDLLDDKAWLEVERDDVPYASDFGSNLIKTDLVQMHGGFVNSPALSTIKNQQINIMEINDDTAQVQLDFHIKTEKLPRNLDHQIQCIVTFTKIDGDWKISQAVLTK